MKSNDSKPSLENLLAEASFNPAPTFRDGLRERLAARLSITAQEPADRFARSNGSHAHRGWMPVRMWQRALAGAVVALAGLISLVAFVPAVQARVADALRHFGVALPFANAGLVISSFTPLAPSSVPDEINFFYSLNLDTGEKKYIELRYFSQDKFIVIYETPAAPGQTLPQGEDIKVAGNDGVLTRQNGGMVLLAAPGPQPWRQSGSGGGGGGGGGGGDGQEAPQMLGYDAATLVTWVQDGMWIELLTNLPEAEAVRLAGTLEPAPQLIEK